MTDKYLVPGTQVLININGITNEEQAEKYERLCATGRIIELKENPIKGDFDFEHLKKIHKYIFQDIYEWAGKSREVNLSKGSTLFCLPDFIEIAQKDIFGYLKSNNYFLGLNKEDFAKKAAYFLGELNALHPFREGNGRTQREFIREVALEAGYSLNLEGTMVDKITRDNMVQASILSINGDNSALERIIKENLVKFSINSKIAEASK